MFQVIKRWIKQYDKWCKELGLTLENKRSCTPYRSDPQPEPKDKP